MRNLYWLMVFAASLLAVLTTLAGCACDDDDDDNDDNDDNDASDDDNGDDDNDAGDDDDDDNDNDDNQIACYRDYDSDGFGDAEVDQDFQADTCPEGWVDDHTDCNDADFLTNPDAAELPTDDIDEDCDGADLIPANDTGIFVAPSGDDLNPGTMEAPMKTIDAGVEVAQASNLPVFVAVGDYTEYIETKVSIHGGYSDETWERGGKGPTRINAATDIGVYITNYAHEKSVALSWLTINGGNAALTAAVYVMFEANLTLVNCVLNGGTSSGTSFGIYVWRDSRLNLLGNTIVNNGEGSDYGVAVDGSTLTMINNIVYFDENGDEAVDVVSSSVYLLNNDLWSSDALALVNSEMTAADVNACEWLGCEEASGNISADPAFADFANGDYHLTAGSPCIDTGVDPTPWYDGNLDDRDWDSELRPVGNGWDIGMDEYTSR
ncbi:MAG: hypothetical protein GX444_12125 [Myxococcales bacterium]|nr:hypothetical protein [Myxococcales bacterium]